MNMKQVLIILFLISSLCHSQTLKGVITHNSLKGVGDDTELSEKSKKPIFFSYTYSNKISLIELISKEGTSIDTVFIELEGVKDTKFETISITIRPYKSIHYKNYNTNTFRFESSQNNKDLINIDTSIKDSIPVYKWTLVDANQKIAGYNCKKATTKKNIGSRTQDITAWYCEDIPISDGPMDFSGLPGLIMQIEIGNLTIVKFERIKFFNDINTDIKEPENKTELLTIKEYYKKLMNGN